VFGNVEGLVGLFTMYSWSDIYELIDSVSFDNYKAIGKDKDEVAANKGKLAESFHKCLWCHESQLYQAFLDVRSSRRCVSNTLP